MLKGVWGVYVLFIHLYPLSVFFRLAYMLRDLDMVMLAQGESKKENENTGLGVRPGVILRSLVNCFERRSWGP